PTPPSYQTSRKMMLKGRLSIGEEKATSAEQNENDALVGSTAINQADGNGLPGTMKGIAAHEYGGPEVLKYEDVPVPEPKENEILVRVIASGVNPADPLILNGKYAKEFGTHLPLILGYDAAGIVVKTGAKVTKLKVGDPVYAYLL